MIRWITPTLGTGAFERVQRDGTFVVVDVRVLLDKRGNPPTLVRAKIDEAADLLRAGHRVVVCCDHGMSRSNAIAAGALALVDGLPVSARSRSSERRRARRPSRSRCSGASARR